MEEIIFEGEARKKLISGITKMAKAVGSTMGPKGKTVIIPDPNNYGRYIITKDGVSVARQIFFKDPVENIGAQMLKEVAELTVKQAGDGTTTATVLAAALINNLQDFDTVDINKAFDEIIPKVLEQLKLNSRELKHEDIKYVATISANNDVQIGEIIQQAYNFSKLVKVEQGTNINDTLTTIDGMSLDTTYMSKHFITDPAKGVCELNEPEVLIVDGTIDTLKPFTNLINRISQESKELLIVADHVSETSLRILEKHVLSGNLKLCVIKSPGFATHRKNLLDDLGLFTGATVVKDQLKFFKTGYLKSCKITNNESILLKGDSINFEIELNSMESFYKENTLGEHDKELLRQRIDNLIGKVAVISVGGGSELEVKERYDRYDDAVKAVACALEEGIVEGGGIALIKTILDLNVIENNINSKLTQSLVAPYSTIFTESNITINDSLDKIIMFDIGLNMFEQNIIDPLKVTRCALENAVSISKTILSTNAVVLNSSEWNIQ